jgi:hypothetical protein
MPEKSRTPDPVELTRRMFEAAIARFSDTVVLTIKTLAGRLAGGGEPIQHAERVLVLARNRGAGKTSGLDLAQIGESANVFQIRAGKVRKLVLYWNRERAFADLGIEE